MQPTAGRGIVAGTRQSSWAASWSDDDDGQNLWPAFGDRPTKRPHAFVAELGLFDALVVPVPPSGADAQAWSAENWNGALQAELLDAIPDHKLRRVPWDATQRGRWAQRREAALATLDVGMIREQRRQAVAAGRSAYMAECVWAERPTAAGMGCPRRARPRGLR